MLSWWAEGAGSPRSLHLDGRSIMHHERELPKTDQLPPIVDSEGQLSGMAAKRV